LKTISKYQIPNNETILCPDCEQSDATIQLVMQHMVGEHQENVLTVSEGRERRYQERLKAYMTRNPPKTPEG
jgi:hypothetical protein